jgi:hypothetical protein
MCLFNINSHALTLADVTIQELYKSSNIVAQVKVTGANISDEINDTGVLFNYNAKVISSFKGKPTATINFQEILSLKVGSEYLLFIDETQNSVKFPITDGIFEFDSLMEIITDEKWVKKSAHRVKIPNYFRTKNLDFEFNNTSANSDYSDYYLVQIIGVLINWEDLNKYLTNLSFSVENKK